MNWQRMKLSRKLIFLVGLIGSSLVVPHSSFTLAAPPTTEPSTHPSIEIQALIRQLSADSWKQRQAAQDRLVVLGDEARDALARVAKESADDETRSRAEAAVVQIDENH